MSRRRENPRNSPMKQLSPAQVIRLIRKAELAAYRTGK